MLTSIYLLHLNNPNQMLAEPKAGPETHSFIHKPEAISPAIAPAKLKKAGMMSWEKWFLNSNENQEKL